MINSKNYKYWIFFLFQYSIMVSYQIVITPGQPLVSILYALGFAIIVTYLFYVLEHKRADKSSNSNKG